MSSTQAGSILAENTLAYYGTELKFYICFWALRGLKPAPVMSETIYNLNADSPLQAIEAICRCLFKKC